MEQKSIQGYVGYIIILVDIYFNWFMYDYFMYVYMHACAFHAVNYIHWFMCIVHVMTTFY